MVWAGGSGVAIFPAGDTPPFDRVPPSEEVTRARLATLMRLHARATPLMVVGSLRGLLRPTLSPAVVGASVTEVKRGDRLPRDRLVGRLVELGYRRESAVSAPGDFAVRGGIVDVFGVDRDRPWRGEWFGDDVEDLRAFDPATQESIAKLESAQVWPARELDLTPESVGARRRRRRCARRRVAARRRARAVGAGLRPPRVGRVRRGARSVLPVPRSELAVDPARPHRFADRPPRRGTAAAEGGRGAPRRGDRGPPGPGGGARRASPRCVGRADRGRRAVRGTRSATRASSWCARRRPA